MTGAPEGPVQQLDRPELGDLPLGDADLQIREDGAVLSTDIRGVPFDVTVDRNGVRVDPRNRERDTAQEAAREGAE